MSVRLSRSRCTSALVLFCCATGQLSRGLAQESKNTAPASPVVGPSQTTARPDGLKQLEDELRHALQSLSPKSAPDTSLAPQYRPPVVVVPDTRAREAAERRKNWLLPEQESLQPSSSSKDWLNSSENPLDTKSKGRNSLDDFYERLNQGNSHRLIPRTTDTDPLGSSSPQKNRGEINSRDDSKLPSGIRDSAKRLQDLLNSNDRFSDRSAPSDSRGFSTFFGRNNQELSPEEIKAHKANIDEYRKVLYGPTPTASTVLTPLAPLGPSSSPLGPGSPAGLSDLGGAPRPKDLDSTPGMLMTVKDPGTLPDQNANALNQWNPLYSQPKAEPPKPAPISVPQAEAPRRRF